MANPSTFRAWSESIVGMSYYAILRVKINATPKEIKAAFHEFALSCHPDRYISDSNETRHAAAEVFKRGVEAYSILSRPALRTRYDAKLKEGKNRLNPNELDIKKKVDNSCETLAETGKGRAHARRADVLLSLGNREGAAAELREACLAERTNMKLRKRFAILSKQK